MIALVVLLGGWLVFRSQKGVWNVPKEPVSVSDQSAVQPTKTVENPTESPEIQTTIDPDVNHWQTKETETFSVKFPKEWYWIDLAPEKPGYYGSHVISNNPDFPLAKYSDIGIFTGGKYPLVLTNDAEIVVTDLGWSTEDAGSPQKSIDASVNTSKEYAADPSEVCAKSSPPGVVPATAFCSFIDEENHQKVQTYLIAYNITTFAFTARTMENNTAMQKSILEKIAKSFTVKDKSFN